MQNGHRWSSAQFHIQGSVDRQQPSEYGRRDGQVAENHRTRMPKQAVTESSPELFQVQGIPAQRHRSRGGGHITDGTGRAVAGVREFSTDVCRNVC
ncbi:MAG: hypothetical protein KDA81_13415 [Planctomycetaceae bacterium]|nr:hypothetical protein [Planctomycetaceae bacterium]